MGYAKWIFLITLGSFLTLSYSEEGISPSSDEKNDGGVDECAPIVTRDDINELTDLAQHSEDYLTGRVKLRPKQVIAFQHLSEESNACKALILTMIPQPESVLEVMETLSETSNPNAQIASQVQTIRRMEMDLSGLTPPEVEALKTVSTASTPTSLQMQAMQSYVTLATREGGLTGFSNAERARILSVVALNLDKGFSVDDLDILREAELRALGLTTRQIGQLDFLASKRGDDPDLTPQDIDLLQRWVVLESLPQSIDTMNFVKLSSLYQLVESQPSPPFSPSAKLMLQKAYLFQLAKAPLVDVRTLTTLQQLAQDVSTYIGSLKPISDKELAAVRFFMQSMQQFGRIPNLNPIQVGALLQLVSLRSDLQNLMYGLKQVRYVERVIAGFSSEQQKALSALAKKSYVGAQVTLTKAEVSLLKMYIKASINPGGLNGFSIDERGALMQIVERQVQDKKNGFRPADVSLLRTVEYANNGFTVSDMQIVNKIVQNKREAQSLSPEDKALVQSVLQVDRALGRKVLITQKQSSFLSDLVIAPSAKGLDTGLQKDTQKDPGIEESARIREKPRQPAPVTRRPSAPPPRVIGPGR